MSARNGVGSGLTAYADAQAEWQELRAKSRVLERPTQSFELLETLRPEQGRYWLLEDHLGRITQSAAYFGFVCDKAALEDDLRALAGVQAESMLAAKSRPTFAPVA